jgi:hypothetical protein
LNWNIEIKINEIEVGFKGFAFILVRWFIVTQLASYCHGVYGKLYTRFKKPHTVLTPKTQEINIQYSMKA